MKPIAVSVVLFVTTCIQALEPEVLYKFQQLSGNPQGIIEGNDGNFYGTIPGNYGIDGGNTDNDAGTIFKVTTNGIMTTLVSFNLTNGAYPIGPLVINGEGSFYGTTKEGGSASLGTVFKLSPSGVLRTLVSFDGTNGARLLA